MLPLDPRRTVRAFGESASATPSAVSDGEDPETLDSDRWRTKPEGVPSSGICCVRFHNRRTPSPQPAARKVEQGEKARLRMAAPCELTERVACILTPSDVIARNPEAELGVTVPSAEDISEASLST